MASGGNPFAALRPALRNEEDDIRRGVFSHVLRNLATATPEQKVYWHTLNEEIQRNVRNRAPVCRTVEAAAVKEEKGVVDLLSTPAATTHEMEPSSSSGVVSTTAFPEFGIKRERGDGTKEGGDGSPPHGAPEAQSSSLPCTPHEAGLAMGAFLHAQVEKTVGTTLNSLSAGTLRVLCLILGIATKSRSKDALYNILASYHYTNCEKLGKRVSRTTFADEMVKQDCQSLHLFLKHPVKVTGTTHKVDEFSPSAAPKTETAAHATSTREEKLPLPPPTTSPAPLSTTASGDIPIGVGTPQKAVAEKPTPSIKQHTPIVKVTRSAPSSPLPIDHYSKKITLRSQSHEQKNITHAAERSDACDTSGIEIAYPKPVLHRSNAAERQGASSFASTSAGDAAKGTEWTPQELEKSIATIVRNFDPVTTTIVIKKLAKMGYNSPKAKQVVESCLHSFHQKKYIYFESGIAYCLD